jgi:cell division septal protein FtsQ
MKKPKTAVSKAKPKAKRANAFRSRRKPAEGEAYRQPLDLSPSTPKLRAEEDAAARRRGFQRAITVVVVLLLIALGYVAVKETVWANPSFALKHIHVHTSGMLTHREIMQATGLTQGVNLLTTDLGAVRARLMNVPAIRGVTVQRDFAGRLDVTVEQRQPIAWVRCEKLGWIPEKSGAGLLVDAEGAAVPCVHKLDSFQNLPEIQDETLEQVVPGSKIEGDQFSAALALLHQLKQREQLGGHAVQRVVVKNACSLEASLSEGLTVAFAWDNLDGELKRYDLVLAEAAKRKWQLQSVHLMAEHNLPITFLSTAKSGAPPSAVPLARPAQRTSSSTRSRR